MRTLKEEKTHESKNLGKSIQAVFILSIILGMYFAVTQAPIIPVMEKGRLVGWKNLDLTATAGHAAITPDQSGFQTIAIYKHHAGTFAQIVAYYSANMTINATNGSTYGNTFENNSHNMSNIPYSTAFDILVYFRWNRTHAKSLSNNTWMLQWVRMNISCPQLHIHNWATGTGFTNMTKVNSTAHNVSYYWVNFIMTNNGSGYQISKGENVSHMYLQPSAYY